MNTLRNVSLFHRLGDEAIEILARRMQPKSFAKGTIVVSEGDDTRSLYVIVDGTVKVFASDGCGRELVLDTPGPGEYFGELALLDDAPRSASVMTLEPCRFSVMSKSAFDECLVAYPEIARVLLCELAGRVRRLTDVARRLALMDVYGRIVATLEELASDEDGCMAVKRRLTHQELAERVGASREMVSRILKDLMVGDYLELRDRRIFIKRKLPATW